MQFRWVIYCHYFVGSILLLLMSSCSSTADHRYESWQVYGGSKENTHYSSLVQIDTSNVNQLQPAWLYHTGDADTAAHSQIQCNPIVVNGILYATSPRLKLLALDAATGKEKWVFNPMDSNQNKTVSDFIMNNNRGVTYWEEGDDKRIFYAAGSSLYAIDAITGKIILSFGNQGRLDLHTGLGDDAKNLFVTATTPGIIYKNLLIMGSRVSEGTDAAPGYIRAFDAKTGSLQWIFHTIPRPGEKGYETWEDPKAYQFIGGANCWAGFSLDEKRGILFAPVGSASFDFYGGKRKGAGLFADCLLALDAATGKYIWHFQDIHHDVWDKDIPAPPVLVTVMHEGKAVDAVAQTTKSGYVFLLNRETGVSLFPVEERVVPADSVMPGEKLWPTQPVPLLPKPIVRQVFNESDLNRLVPDSSYQDIKKRLAGYRTGNMFNPPSREGTVILPGYDGGAEWGGPAYDPGTGLLYVNANEMAWILTMVEVPKGAPVAENNEAAGKRLYLQNCMGCHGTDRKGSGSYPSLLGAAGKYTEPQFAQLVTTGRRMMPAFKQLSDAERTALASFILDLKSKQNQKFIAPPKTVDTVRDLPFKNTGYNKFLTREGYPAIAPPWGTLTALDMNTGATAWTIALGEYPEWSAKGIATGTENYGGPVVTYGGLLFIAATRDGKIRAFNKRTGKLLWQASLPAAGFATPAMYWQDGKQYLVLACGGGKLGTASGDAYIAFALPEGR